MIGCVTSEKNQNLAHFDKLLLHCNFKLRRTGFSTVDWIGSQGWMRKMGDRTASKNFKITKCEACQYGNQEINPKYGTRKSKDKEFEILLERN